LASFSRFVSATSPVSLHQIVASGEIYTGRKYSGKISNMSKLPRAVLAGLLILAIPVQGFAATAMLFCVSGHQHDRGATTTDQPPAHDRHSDFSGHASLHPGNMQAIAHRSHDEAKFATSLQPEDAIQGDSVPIQVGKLGDGKCSACATCCTGSVIVNTQSVSPVAMTGSDLIPSIQESFLSHISEGFDPPPRSILA
jgi:hypothetical protein